MLKAQRLAALAAVLVVGTITPAGAVTVTYSTSGVFGVNGTNSLTLVRDGITVSYNPISTSVDAGPDGTSAQFGSFSVANTSGTPDASAEFGTSSFTDTFTLTIVQSAPSPGGDVEFSSTLSGTFTFVNNVQSSTLFVQFDQPLFQTISGPVNNVTYEIFTDGQPVPGRVAIAAGAPSSPISGQISVVTIPEPGTMVLACLALPMLGLGYVRRHRRQVAA